MTDKESAPAKTGISPLQEILLCYFGNIVNQGGWFPLHLRFADAGQNAMSSAAIILQPALEYWFRFGYAGSHIRNDQ